jgi:hypothetical protein
MSLVVPFLILRVLQENLVGGHRRNLITRTHGFLGTAEQGRPRRVLPRCQIGGVVRIGRLCSSREPTHCLTSRPSHWWGLWPLTKGLLHAYAWPWAKIAVLCMRFPPLMVVVRWVITGERATLEVPMPEPLST